METDGLEWKKGWSSGGYSLAYNGQTERRYNGINRMILMFKAMEAGWSDPRYYTFHQVSQMDGCKIRAGEKATAVEYWLIRDTKQKRSMTFAEYEKLLKDDPSRKEAEFYAYPKVAYVFNASQVEGLKPLQQPERGSLEENKLAEEVIKTMAENMEVRLIYGGDEAFYRPATDTVHLPPQDAFFTVNGWASTTLHELAHATSAPTRLDRPVVGYHQDPEAYAKEELFAELASVYASAEIGVEMADSVINNHAAYVQHWLKAIEENHNVLFTAIKEADKIADYLIEKGRVAELKEKLTLAASAPKIVPADSAPVLPAPEVVKEKAAILAKATKYQEIEIFDIPGLFSNGRIRSSDIPEGLYRYDLRGADYDPGEPITVENYVVVNHAGSILTAKQLDIPEGGFLWLTEEEGLNFVGGEITAHQFLAEQKNNITDELQATQNQKTIPAMSYEIWQLKDVLENKALLFSDYAYASLFRLDESRYDKVYEARVGADDDSLASIYYKFNVNHPADFKGHSVSMSDVIVLNDNGKKTAYYVDRIGFREISNFCKPPHQTEKRGRTR